MDLKWEFRTQVPYSELTAEVTEDTGEFSAIITGEIVMLHGLEIPMCRIG